jgi:hypothetical protein
VSKSDASVGLLGMAGIVGLFALWLPDRPLNKAGLVSRKNVSQPSLAKNTKAYKGIS